MMLIWKEDQMKLTFMLYISKDFKRICELSEYK